MDAKTSKSADPRSVTFILHKFDRGGSPRVAAYLANGFSEVASKVELLVFTSGGEVDGIIAPLAGSAVAVTYLGNSRGPRWLDLARGMPSLVQRLRETSPDVVIAGANNVALVTAAAVRTAACSKTRLFLKTTNPIATSRHRGVVKALRRWTYRNAFQIAAGVWTLSPSETSEMQSAFPEFSGLFRDVYNPYVTPEMFEGEFWNPEKNERPFILAVGRLTKQKRFERLIEAFALVHDPTVRLVILGEGEERDQLIALARRLGVANRVDMPGYVENVAAAYAQARLFVLTSDYEGLPAVLLEAMASNCPILTTDCFPAARAIIEGAKGCSIIERTDPTSLAAQIDAHLDLPRPAGLRAIAERYSIESGVRSHLEAAGWAQGRQKA